MQSVLVFEETCRCYMCSHKDLEVQQNLQAAFQVTSFLSLLTYMLLSGRQRFGICCILCLQWGLPQLQLPKNDA
jgi:hypothetical protein